MFQRRGASGMLAPILLFALLSPGAADAQRDDDAKPSLSLRATPSVGFSPLRVRFSVEVRGGADDFEDFYCPVVEWDFGDDSVSGNSADCPPYEPGKTTIQRRYSTEHTFRYFGVSPLTVRFSLKQGDRVVGSTTTRVTVSGDVDDRE